MQVLHPGDFIYFSDDVRLHGLHGDCIVSKMPIRINWKRHGRVQNYFDNAKVPSYFRHLHVKQSTSTGVYTATMQFK